jgi:hypothetical protein
MYVYAYIHTYIHVCVCIHTYIHAYMHTYIHTCLQASNDRAKKANDNNTEGNIWPVWNSNQPTVRPRKWSICTHVDVCVCIYIYIYIYIWDFQVVCRRRVLAHDEWFIRCPRAMVIFLAMTRKNTEKRDELCKERQCHVVLCQENTVETERQKAYMNETTQGQNTSLQWCC